MLDISCGGHVAAGEDSLETAIRELGEEIGLKVNPNELTYIETFQSSSRPSPNFINNTFSDMYILHMNKNIGELCPQPEEVSELLFVLIEEFRKMVDNKCPDLVPHQRMYRKFLEIMDNSVRL